MKKKDKKKRNKKRRKNTPAKLYPTFREMVKKDSFGVDRNVVIVDLPDAVLKNGETVEIVWDPLVMIVSD